MIPIPLRKRKSLIFLEKAEVGLREYILKMGPNAKPIKLNILSMIWAWVTMAMLIFGVLMTEIEIITFIIFGMDLIIRQIKIVLMEMKIPNLASKCVSLLEVCNLA